MSLSKSGENNRPKFQLTGEQARDRTDSIDSLITFLDRRNPTMGFAISRFAQRKIWRPWYDLSPEIAAMTNRRSEQAILGDGVQFGKTNTQRCYQELQS